MKITKELLEANGWGVDTIYDVPVYAFKESDEWYAEWKLGRTTLTIYPHEAGSVAVDYDYELFIRNCDTTEKLAAAFRLCGFEYELKTE